MYFIPDTSLTASSTLATYDPAFSRLSSQSAWGAASSDETRPWIQADLGQTMQVQGVITAGHSAYSEYTTQFTIEYGDTDSASFSVIQDAEWNVVMFLANTDATTQVINMFPTAIVARYVRLHIEEFRLWPSTRWELLGCENTGEIIRYANEIQRRTNMLSSLTDQTYM